MCPNPKEFLVSFKLLMNIPICTISCSSVFFFSYTDAILCGRRL
jgi:hypothetical protein